jgi:hypothetical protein
MGAPDVAASFEWYRDPDGCYVTKTALTAD